MFARNASSVSSLPRVIRQALFLLVAFILPPLVVTVARFGARVYEARRPVEVEPMTTQQLIPEHVRGARTAVVVTGNGGAETSDFLIPYEVLARTKAFEMYVVAPEEGIVPLASAMSRNAGLDLVPHHSLDGYDALVGERPDVIVIPYLPEFAQGGERQLVPWIRKYADQGSLVVSVCAGAEVLAATGIVDGQKATTHPQFHDKHTKEYPGVEWVRGVRYVETNRAISSGAIASGMDGTLAAVRRMVGRDAAERVASELGYTHTHFLDDPSYDGYRTDAGVLWSLAFGRPSASAVMMYDGISEVELGSVFDTYPLTGRRLVSVAPERRVIVSKNGMHFLPRATMDSVTESKAVIVPGEAVPAATQSMLEAWASARGANVVNMSGGTSRFAYDAALQDIARRDGTVVARSVATNLAYPSTQTTLEGPTLSTRLVLVPFTLGFLGIALAVSHLASKRVRPATARKTRTSGECACAM